MRGSAFSVWSLAHDRLIPEVWPHINRDILAMSGDTVFTIGSCFARNIETHLHRLGFDIPTLRFSTPRTEWPDRPNGIMNKYTPPAIFQEIAWAAKIHDRDGVVREDDLGDIAHAVGDGMFIDLQLGGFFPVTRERLFNRRKELYAVFETLFKSHLIVMTLGLIEAWLDTTTNLYIDQTPFISRSLRKDLSRFIYTTLDHAECLNNIQRAVDLVLERNPKARFLLTTSPVSLGKTFTDDDVIVANMHSKSKLRSVCGEVAANNEAVTYFPSFESAILTKSWSHWAEDRIHVTDAFVMKVVERLLKAHFEIPRPRRLYYRSFSEDAPTAMATIDMALTEEDNPVYYTRLGQLLIQEGKYAEAREALRESIARDPSPAEPYQHLAVACLRLGDHDAALAAIRNAIDIAPKALASHLGLGEILLAQDDLGGAAVAARAALALAPNLPQAHFQLSLVFSRASAFEEAIHEALTATLLNSANPHYHHHLGVLYRKTGNSEKAVEAFKKSITLDHGLAASYYELSAIHARQNNIGQAIADIHAAIRLKNDEPLYQRRLAELMRCKGGDDASTNTDVVA